MILEAETLCWVSPHLGRSEFIELGPALYLCGSRINGRWKPRCPVFLLLESHFMNLFRGVSLAGGCVVSKGGRAWV